MPGLTRPEADAAARWLAAVPDADRHLALAEVALAVLLSDGAGPYLLGADGELILVLGPHPHIAGVHVAMGGQPSEHRVGAVGPLPDGGWLWLARAGVQDDQRVPALDSVAAVAAMAGLTAWAREWAGTVPSVGA